MVGRLSGVSVTNCGWRRETLRVRSRNAGKGSTKFDSGWCWKMKLSKSLSWKIFESSFILGVNKCWRDSFVQKCVCKEVQYPKL